MSTDDDYEHYTDDEYKARIVARLWHLDAVDNDVPLYARVTTLAKNVAREGESGRVWFLIGAMAETDYAPVKWAGETGRFVTLEPTPTRIQDYTWMMDPTALPPSLRSLDDDPGV